MEKQGPGGPYLLRTLQGGQVGDQGSSILTDPVLWLLPQVVLPGFCFSV